MKGIVIYVTCLQHVGKTTYIREVHKRAPDVDFEDLWRKAKADGQMDKYEMATYVKGMALYCLQRLMDEHRTEIVVECTGMSKVSQAFIKAMIDVGRQKGYISKVVYLKVYDVNSERLHRGH